MSLKYTTEHEQLRSVLREFFSEQAGSSYLRKRIEKGGAFDAGLWSKFAQLGMFTFFAELGEEQGAEGGLHELGLVAYEAGRVVCPENVVDSLLCGPLFLSSAEKVVAATLAAAGLEAEAIRNGSKRSALQVFSEEEWLELRSSFSLERSAVNYTFRDLHGVEGADFVIVVPFIAALRSESEALLIPVGGERAKSWQYYRGLDLTSNLARTSGSNNAAYLLNGVDVGQIVHSWCALRAAELAGMAAACVAMTVDYVSNRKQFGAPVGSFQAVQHKLADAHVQAEALAALASFATWASSSSAEQFPLAARAALSFGRKAASQVIESAIQLHGGIGFTWEFDLHLYLRRARAIEALGSFLDSNESHEAIMNLVDDPR